MIGTSIARCVGGMEGRSQGIGEAWVRWRVDWVIRVEVLVFVATAEGVRMSGWGGRGWSWVLLVDVEGEGDDVREGRKSWV